MDFLDVEAFITAISSKPVLWNKKSKEFRDRAKAKAAWNEICEGFIEDYDDLPAHEKLDKANILKQKWGNLRDSWMKSYKRRKRDGEGRKKKYVFHDQLKFLKLTLDERDTGGKSSPCPSPSLLDEHSEDVDGPESYFEDSQHPTTRPVPEAAEEGGPSYLREEPPVETSVSVNPLHLLELPSPPRGIKRKAKSRRRVSPKDELKVKLLDILDKRMAGNEDQSFFDSILPIVARFDEDQKIEFRLEVLKLIKRIKSGQFASSSTDAV